MSPGKKHQPSESNESVSSPAAEDSRGKMRKTWKYYSYSMSENVNSLFKLCNVHRLSVARLQYLQQEKHSTAPSGL